MERENIISEIENQKIIEMLTSILDLTMAIKHMQK